MAVEPLVNKNQEKVKAIADRKVARLLNANDEWATKDSKVDIAYLSAIWAPHCDEDSLEIVVDWNHWVFLFDDQFNEGHLSIDPVAAQDEVEQTLAIMEETQPPVEADQNKVRYLFRTIWDRVKKRASPEFQKFYRDMHQSYFEGIVCQVKLLHDGATFPHIEQHLEMRRKTIGVYPAIAMVAVVCNAQPPRDVLDHASIIECINVSADLVHTVNDVTSIRKDIGLGTEHNIIIHLMEQGCTTQQAMDKLDDILHEDYRRWYTALAEMPIWGESIDRQVLKFIDVCRNVALGNLYWSFMTARYLGGEGDHVSKMRVLTLPPLLDGKLSKSAVPRFASGYV